ncbi:MAG TPA: hypothetical protein H9819_02345 [Candidatus Bacteroides merdipullorum]|uniref:Major fimbrial subunit protein N-terminal domain-containing protein n=1 Tax=Candidatus Bacteroides merdipullorum TaxID=2838474 RepID=A0A9D2A2S7_9BACE|nr:hypothetical protein [Candidatus Bacteroides merdipullorum]
MTRTYLFLLTLLLGLAACTDDLARTDTPQPGPGEGLISLSLPGIVYDNADPTATRTQTDDDEADATQEERRITSLWFMAYPTTDGGGETLVQLLRPSNNELTHDYQTFPIRIKAGTYKIYVVANMPEIGPQTTEEELRQIVLDYRNGESLVLPSTTGNGLPMVYESTDTVTITAAQSQKIQADLVFTCVKVRCTLWFDNTDGGHSHNVFGKNYLLMQDITGRNIATQAPLLPTGKAIEGMELLCTAEGALNGHYADDEYSEDAHEDLTFTQTTTSNTGKWAYRSTTFYLPEHYVKQNDDQSYLDITAALHDATGVKKANVAYTLPLGDEPTDSQPLRQLPRGKYYDIVGKIVNLGGEIESNVAIMDWTVETVSAELESPYHLWVEKTSTPLKAGDSISIALRTDSPTLTTEQAQVTIGGKEIDPYILTLNKDSETGAYTSVSIEVNPELVPGSTVPDDAKKFYIVMQNHDGDAILKKEIKIEPLDLEPYLTVTPEQYIIRISDIGNLPEHTVIFSYETNLTEVNVTCGNTTITTTGISWSENSNVTITDSGLQDGKGTVSVTLNTPYDPAAYPTLQTVVLDYEATGTHKPDASTTEETITLTDQTTVTIIPNAQTYRLHFRPVDDSWTNPHIYVYEPLYGMDGREIRIQNANGDDEGEHALQYSFTGKRTFKGWTEQGGTISWSTQQKEDKGNYWLVDYGWDPIRTELYVYYDNIDYSPDFRTDCCASDVNPKWPGVKMKVDTENPGWFYFDLPALAEPDKTLIMFAEGHDGNNDPQERYPAHMVPGVPLYDYADKEGWFLYDWNESDQNEFVDDKPSVPEIEYLNGNTLPDGIYRIYSRRTHFWLWIDGGGNYSTGAWPGEYYVGTMGKDGDNPYYYYYEMVVNSSSRPSWTPGTIQCACTNNGDTGSRIDRTIQVSDWKRVQGSNYYYYVIN